MRKLKKLGRFSKDTQLSDGEADQARAVWRQNATLLPARLRDFFMMERLNDALKSFLITESSDCF